MAKAKNSVDGSIEKLASIADTIQELHNGNTMVVFEMTSDQFEVAAKKMKVSDSNRFTINISGTDFIFLNVDES